MGKAYFPHSASQIFIFIIIVFLIIFGSCSLAPFLLLLRQLFLAKSIYTGTVPTTYWHKKQRVK